MNKIKTILASILIANFLFAGAYTWSASAEDPPTSPSTQTTEPTAGTDTKKDQVDSEHEGASGTGTTADSRCAGRILGFPTWYKGLPCGEDGTPQVSSLMQLWVIALNILEMLIIAAGYLAIGFFAWGGFSYMSASGDPGKISAAKTTLLNAVIGLVIVLSAVAIIDFVQKGIQSGL